MKKVLITLSLFIPFFVFAQEVKKDYHETFDVDEGSVLNLKHGDGDVTVTPWDRDVIDITVRYRAEFKTYGFGSKRDFEVEFRQSGDDVYVLGKERGSGVTIGVHSSRRFEYSYKIKAPKYVELNFSGDDGEISIRDWKGNIECNLDDGDIDLQNIQAKRTKINGEDGNIRIEALNSELFIDLDDGDIYLRDCNTPECRITGEDGEINIRDSQGDFDITGDDGDIELLRVKVEKLSIKTNDGDLELDLLETDQIDLDISTDDGNVTMDIERGISADFLLNSDDGKVRVDVPDIKNYEEGKRRKSGEIGRGRGRIRVRTNGGNISMRESR
jgi:DUF4097 and DUF4098 domain-containing protein YvlB